MGILSRNAIGRRVVNVLLSGLLGFLLFACAHQATQPTQSNSPTASCSAVQHEFGETQICGQPQRVVALDPRVLDMLLSLDLEPVGIAGIRPTGYTQDALVAGSPQAGDSVEKVQYFGDRLTTNPVYVGTWNAPSLETMLTLKPDLILGRHMDASRYSTLAQLAPVLPLNADLEEWQQDLLTLAQVVGREQQAQQVIEQYRQTVASTQTQLQQDFSGAKALLLDMQGVNDVSVMSDQNYMGALLEDLGFELVIPDAAAIDYGIVPISLEVLPQLGADLIFVIARGNLTEQIKQLWAQNSILSATAQRADRLLFLDFYLWAAMEGPIADELKIKDIESRLLSKS